MSVIPAILIIAFGILLSLAPVVLAVRIIEGRTPVTQDSTYLQIRSSVICLFIGFWIYTLGLIYIVTT